MHMSVGEELFEKKLLPTFKLERTIIGFIVGIGGGSCTPMILAKKKRESECTSSSNTLGLNGFQFAKDMHELYIIPFICSLSNYPVISTLQQME